MDKADYHDAMKEFDDEMKDLFGGENNVKYNEEDDCHRHSHAAAFTLNQQDLPYLRYPTLWGESTCCKPGLRCR